MGMLLDGQWADRWYDTAASGGSFVRADSAFRDRITADGASGFLAAAGRYHLYVSYACPWAHRVLIMRSLMKLEEVLPTSVVHPLMLENGWEFGSYSGSTNDPVGGASYLHEVYTRARSDYTGRVTVPIVWDKESGTIVNNESAEIIRMLNSEFGALTDVEQDFYPEPLRADIDEINAVVYEGLNNGVYRTGFATTQQAYEAAVADVFHTLDRLERRLEANRYLVGSQITEADWRLFTTLVRFDPVYHGHFKCNRRKLIEYPNLWAYTRELFQVPGVAQTVHFNHITEHYYGSHRMINPTGVVPVGPSQDFEEPHGRDGLE